MKKKLSGLVILLSMALLFSVASAAAADVYESGVCGADGDNLTWTLDEDGTLTISGHGDMQSGKPTWYDETQYIRQIIIGSGVTSISENVFENCHILSSVTMGDDVAAIGAGAFRRCESLESIKLPDKLSVIENETFFECKSLPGINIPDGVTSIGDSAFQSCSSLTGVEIPGSVASIGTSAFEGCSSLNNVKVNEGVTSIESNAFEDCTSLYDITLPDSLIDLPCNIVRNTALFNDENSWEDDILYVNNILLWGRETMTGKRSIKSNTVCIAESAFEGCDGLTEVYCPDSVKYIGSAAFTGCKKLENITLPNNIDVINGGLFYDCDSLKQIVIPSGVTSIGSSAFRGCDSLTDITVPDAVTSIGAGAFSYCPNLENITLPDNIKSIGEGIVSSTAYASNSENKEDGLLYCGSYLLASDVFPTNKTSYKIRQGTTVIADKAIETCYYATEITIPDSVIYLGAYAFHSWRDIKTIVIPPKVSAILEHTFDGCTDLETIYIPSNVKSIGYHAFASCGVKDIYYGGTEQQWNDIDFDRSSVLGDDVVIHYNSSAPSGQNSLPEPTVASADGGYVITANINDTGTACAAVYDADGKLLYVDRKPFSDGAANVAPYIPVNAAYIKFFVWAGNTLQPITAEKTVIM